MTPEKHEMETAMMKPEKLKEALEIVALIRSGKPIPCGKGPADEYLMALDAALTSQTKRAEEAEQEREMFRRQAIDQGKRREQAEAALRDEQTKVHEQHELIIEQGAKINALRSRAEEAEGALADLESVYRKECAAHTKNIQRLAELRSLVADYREGIDRDGTVAWSKEEAAAWYRAAGEALTQKEPTNG